MGQTRLAHAADESGRRRGSSPWLGRSSPAIRFNSVVLPEPLGPIKRQKFALRHVEAQVEQHVDLLAAAAKELVDVRHADNRLRPYAGRTA